MRELRSTRVADAVADRPHPGDVRPHAVVDRYAETIRRETGLLDAREVRDPTGTQQNVVPFEGLLFAVDLGAHRDCRAGPLHLNDLRVDSYLDAAMLERTEQKTHELGIRVCDRLRKHLEHRDLTSDLGEEGAKLEPDRAAADHDEALGNL